MVCTYHTTSGGPVSGWPLLAELDHSVKAVTARSLQWCTCDCFPVVICGVMPCDDLVSKKTFTGVLESIIFALLHVRD